MMQNDIVVASEKTARSRSHMLDVLKGIAILFVVITHADWDPAQRLQLGFYYWIDMAVPIFMLITGYLHAASYRRAGGVTRESLKKQISRSLVKYTVPFGIAYILEALFYTVFTVVTLKTLTAADLWSFFIKLFQGGWGPGSYYYPVLVQLVFLFPCIFLVVEKYKTKGLLLCGVANVLFEVTKFAWAISKDTYRMLALRYIFVLALGCWLFMEENHKHRTIAAIVCGLIGAVFISLVCYLGYQPRLFIYWTTTCMISAMFAVPAVAVSLEGKFRCRPLEKLGEASYAIFLVQMVWYGCGGRKFLTIISDSFMVELSCSVIACVVAGLIFHLICGKYIQFVLGRLPQGKKD